MESPTTEISMGMEAMRLGITDKCVEDTSTSSGCTPLRFESNKNLQTFESLVDSNKTIPSAQFNPSLPQFSQLQAPLDSGQQTDPLGQQKHEPTNTRVFCLEPTPSCDRARDVLCTCKNRADAYCQECCKLEQAKETTQQPSVTHTEQDIIDSFNYLHVNGQPVQLVPTSAPQRLHRTTSCRQQEAAYYSGNYNLDDTTVDDLAGYFDEIMYLPKPMSEMAELMYT